MANKKKTPKVKFTVLLEGYPHKVWFYQGDWIRSSFNDLVILEGGKEVSFFPAKDVRGVVKGSCQEDDN